MFCPFVYYRRDLRPSGKGRAGLICPTAFPRTFSRSLPSTEAPPPPHWVSFGRDSSEAPPPRVCALAEGRGSGVLTPGGRGGRAEGKRGLGLAGAVRGGETVVGLLLVPEPVRPEGRGDSGGGRRQQHGGRV